MTFWRSDDIRLKENSEIKGSMGWWYELQIRNLFYADKCTFGFMRTYTDLDEVLVGDKNKVIAKIYKISLKTYTQDEAVKIQLIKWAQNFNRAILMEEWDFFFWNHTLKTTECMRIKKKSIKMFYRWYVTPEKIAKMSKKAVLDKCWKCDMEKGIFYNLW